MTHSYQISGMTCGSCVARVKSELLKLGDVQEVKVQLASPQAVITMGKHIDTGRLQKAVSNAGAYTIDEVSGNAGAFPYEKGRQEKIGYYPIFLIFGYIAAGSLLVQWVSGHFDLMQWMSHFMAGFFLVFSFFKLLSLRAFAQSYQAYDIIARAVPRWGFVYPFVELALGLLFLSGVYPLGTNVATFLVMSISTVGVIQSLLKKKDFQCACLGTIIKLPLSRVTLFEDILMVVMSAVMIALIA